MDRLLRGEQGEFWYYGKSALDRYEKNKPRIVSVATTAGLGELARSFDDLFFPGLEGYDGAAVLDGVTFIFKSVDSFSQIPSFSLSPFNLIYSVGEDRFIDREGEYERLRSGGFEGDPRTAADWEELIRLAAWSDKVDLTSYFQNELPSPLFRERNRFFLEDILTGPRAEGALAFLKETGWIKAQFPALDVLSTVVQDKEFHPEGNVWEHTLETLKYRKERPMNLSLGLLFHDLGKGSAQEVGGNRFNGHAQIGARQLRSIFEDWNLPEILLGETIYLVENHMMPAAIDRLPYHKKKDVIEDPLFPLLLELYRCDLSSSFNGLDGYYNACRHYKSFKKNVQNPYRQADGSLKRGAS
ncbi:MAG: HD domain-containing protein [Spirochaetales bacterium]|nr:HD domain-containing protein [Spirochaetales bacterium]